RRDERGGRRESERAERGVRDAKEPQPAADLADERQDDVKDERRRHGGRDRVEPTPLRRAEEMMTEGGERPSEENETKERDREPERAAAAAKRGQEGEAQVPCRRDQQNPISRSHSMRDGASRA